MNKRIIKDKATLELATAQAAKSILERIDTLEQELVDERYSKRKVQARHDDLAAELADWQRMRNEAMAVAEANRDRIRELEAELNEQARVNGMGGSREAALLAKVARLEKALRELVTEDWRNVSEWDSRNRARALLREVSQAETAVQSCPICSAIGGHLVSCERWELLGSTAETFAEPMHAPKCATWQRPGVAGSAVRPPTGPCDCGLDTKGESSAG